MEMIDNSELLHRGQQVSQSVESKGGEKEEGNRESFLGSLRGAKGGLKGAADPTKKFIQNSTTSNPYHHHSE